jgi:MoaA/NifB/PqqE/SkfB family radical SAM enzyme
MPRQRSPARALPMTGVAVVAAEGSFPSPSVSGPRKAIVVAGLWARVMWLAVRTYRNPFRAARALRSLRAAPRRQQWTAPTRRARWFWTSQKFVCSSGRYFWDLYMPGWPSVAFDRYVERELQRVDSLGRPSALNTAIVAITKRCALKCEHCFEWDVLNQSEPLSTDDLHDILRRVQQRGVAQLFFSGGEPLQRFGDLLSLSASASPDTDVWILTSGLGLTADKARRLRAAGVTGLAVSLDHWDASAHDQFRGLSGSFEAVERAARYTRDAGLLVALTLCPTRTFVTRENLDRYAQTARSLGASFIQIVEPKPLGHYAGQDVALEPAQRRVLERFCERLNTDASARDLPMVQYADWSARTQGCVGAGDRYIYIDTDGDLHACPFCRAPGLRVLNHDFDAALRILQDAGCPAGNPCPSHVDGGHSHTTRTCH